MSWLSDRTLERLRSEVRAPDLTGSRYRLLGEVGRGGMGSVFLVEDTLLDRRVALKVLDVPDGRGDLAERLVRESRVLARLEHPGIVPVHEVGRLADGRVFYTMKYVQGQRLDRYAAARPALQDRLRLFQRICEAVAFAHDRGVLHRDLKPENVMVGPFGEVLVMDWGVAKISDQGPPSKEVGGSGAAPADHGGASGDAPSSGHPTTPGAAPMSARAPAQSLVPAASSRTAHGAILGTPGYMAPEQASGDVDRVDARADIFALGAVLRFLLTGEAPSDATTRTVAGPPHPARPAPSSAYTARAARAGNTDVPRALLAIFTKAMAQDPEHRYASALDLAADVARYLDGRRVLAYPEGPLQKAARLYARHRVAFWLIVTYLVVRGTALIVLGR